MCNGLLVLMCPWGDHPVHMVPPAHTQLNVCVAYTAECTGKQFGHYVICIVFHFPLPLLHIPSLLNLSVYFSFLPCSPILYQDLHMGLEIQAANGKKLRAMEVFAHALRFFKDHCLQELSDQSSTRIVNDDIRWVITVPAIWRQPAKQFMRQASYKVG